MKTVTHRWMRPLLAALIVAVLVGGAAVATASQDSQSGEQSASHSRKGARNHQPQRGKRGKRGKRGPRGAAGPAGPAGPAGSGTPYAFALRTNAQTTAVFDGNGLRIEAGCINGALELTARAEGGDHNILEVTSFDNNEAGRVRGTTAPEAAINQPFDMLAGGSPVHDYNGLLALRTLGGQMTTVQWWAMGSSNASQGDCVGGGTVSP